MDELNVGRKRVHNAAALQAEELGQRRDEKPKRGEGAGKFQRVRGKPEQLGAEATRDVKRSVVGARIKLLSETRSRDEWLARVKKDWHALENAPPEIKADKEIALAALSQDKAAYLLLAPELHEDRAFLLEAVKVRPAVIRLFEDRWLDDRTFVLEALKAHDLVSYGLLEKRPQYFHDLELAKEVFKTQPLAWEALKFAKDPLADDPEYATAIAKVAPQVVARFSPALLADRRLLDGLLDARRFEVIDYLDPAMVLASPRLQEVQAALVSGEMSSNLWPLEVKSDARILPYLIAGNRRLLENEKAYGAALNKDPELARAVLEQDPLLFKELPKILQRTLDRTHPELRRNAEAIEKQLHALHMDNLPARVTRFSTIRELIKNATTPDENDPRPLAVYVYPTADWNGAFKSNDIEQLLKSYRVVYREVSTDKDAIQAIKDATERRPADLLFIGGHGTQKETMFGDQPWLPLPWWTDGMELDLGDEKELLAANIRERVAKGGNVILESCSTGEGREKENNMANMLSRLFPQATIHSPIEPAHGHVVLDDNGRFVDVSYGSNTSTEYEVPPSVSARLRRLLAR